MRAYERDAFPSIPDGMGRPEFQAYMEALVERGMQAWLIIGKVKRGELPIGMVLTSHHGRVAEPHVAWFPWATPRQKLEGAIAFLEGFPWLMVIVTEEKNWDFFDRLADYGVVHPVGRIKGMFEAGDARIWQTEMMQ